MAQTEAVKLRFGGRTISRDEYEKRFGTLRFFLVKKPS
jgi:hypothetical protein